MKTASGARAVQIVYSSRREARDIEHIGSAHDDAELAVLTAVARLRMSAGQGELDLGLERIAPTQRMGGRCRSRRRGWVTCGTPSITATGYSGSRRPRTGDDVFRQLVLARIIERTSKLDSVRVLDEAGVSPPSYRTVKRRLPVFAQPSWRQRLAAACAAHAGLGPASLVLYDVSTLYFETDTDDGFREPGFSKERRLEPQITIGLPTD